MILTFRCKLWCGSYYLSCPIYLWCDRPSQNILKLKTPHARPACRFQHFELLESSSFCVDAVAARVGTKNSSSLSLNKSLAEIFCRLLSANQISSFVHKDRNRRRRRSAVFFFLLPLQNLHLSQLSQPHINSNSLAHYSLTLSVSFD